MKKLLVNALGVLLSAAALTAFADKDHRENLTQCKSDVQAYYGDSARIRLRSIKQGTGQSDLTLMVTPKGAGNTVVICSVRADGTSSLATRDGIALVPDHMQTSAGQSVSLAR